MRTELADYLAHHPSTARTWPPSWCVRFVADEPPAALVDRLAKVYLDNDTAIVPVLRALFLSPEFAAAAFRKIKRPIEDNVATVRLLDQPAATADLKAAALELARRVPGQARMSWARAERVPRRRSRLAVSRQRPGPVQQRSDHVAGPTGGARARRDAEDPGLRTDHADRRRRGGLSGRAAQPTHPGRVRRSRRAAAGIPVDRRRWRRARRSNAGPPRSPARCSWPRRPT